MGRNQRGDKSGAWRWALRGGAAAAAALLVAACAGGVRADDSASPAPRSPAGAPLPPGPAGAALAGLLRAIGSGDSAAIERFAAERYHERYLAGSYGHRGADPGVSAHLWVYPEASATVVVLSNYDTAANLVGDYIRELLVPR